MRAAVYTGKGEMEIRDIPRPGIGPGEVLLRVRACSICGTDRKIFNRGHFKIGEGEDRILGHEITGEIAGTGEGVEYYTEGMRVAVAPNVGCGVCTSCRRGLDQLCPEYDAFGITWPGGFAEYVRVPAPAVRRGNLVEIPEGVDFSEAAIVEPLACCYSGYEALDAGPGDSVMIMGAGPMGNLHLMLNRHLGCGRTFVVDIDRERLEFSRRLGADFTLENDGGLADRVMELTGGEGVDVVITAAPVPVVQRQALELVAINGGINFFAGLPGDAEEVEINTNTVHYRQLRIVGNTGSTREQFRRTMRLVESGLDVNPIITRRADLQELVGLMADDEALDANMKIVIEFDSLTE